MLRSHPGSAETFDGSADRVEVEEGRHERHHAPFMQRKAAIRFVNGPSMQDLAYEYVYGRRIERDICRALMWTAAHQAKYRAHPCAEKLHQMLRKANDCSLPVTRKDARRAVDYVLITKEKDGTNVYYFLTPAQVENARELLKLLDLIPEVVRVQEKSPHDKRAGADL